MKKSNPPFAFYWKHNEKATPPLLYIGKRNEKATPFVFIGKHVVEFNNLIKPFLQQIFKYIRSKALED